MPLSLLHGALAAPRISFDDARRGWRVALGALALLAAVRSEHRRDRAVAGSPCFASVHVVSSLEDASEAWAHLAAIAPMSPYQRQAWVDAWMRTEGRLAAVTPMIVIARDAAGVPVALLPMGVARYGGVRRASFLGGRHTNYHMGLFDPRLAWSPAETERLLRLAVRQGGGVDLFELQNQPCHWGAFANPLAHLPHSQPSPSACHGTRLEGDGEAWMRETLSSAGRKKLRSKASHLAAIGPVAYRVARSPGEIRSVIEAHLRQKAVKLSMLGIAVGDVDALRRFLTCAATTVGEDGAPAMELHALACGDRIVATFGGLAHAGRFSGTLISYESEAPYARCSPGDLLIAAIIKAKCAEGFSGFDLGVGEARYKSTFCPLEEPLADSFLSITLRGQTAMLARSLLLKGKATIKRSPRLLRLAQAARKTLFRARQATLG